MDEQRQIKSKNDLFLGELVDKPLRVKVTLSTSDDEPIYKCPHCGEMITDDDCGVLGAEPGCLFCNKCNREFEL